MPILELNVLSLALLGAAAVAFTRRRRAVVWVTLALFVPIAMAATLGLYWPIHPVLAVAVLVPGMAVPLLGLALWGLDRLFARFTAEMTYAGMLCWVLWPPLVMVNFVAMLLSAGPSLA